MINLSKEIINEEMNNFFINNKDNFKFCLTYESNRLIKLIINDKEYK